MLPECVTAAGIGVYRDSFGGDTEFQHILLLWTIPPLQQAV